MVLGVLGLSPTAGWAQQVANQPVGLLVAAALFTLAGSIYQLFVKLSPDERAKFKTEQAQAKIRLAEKKRIEDRWTHYTDDKGI